MHSTPGTFNVIFTPDSSRRRPDSDNTRQRQYRVLQVGRSEDNYHYDLDTNFVILANFEDAPPSRAWQRHNPPIKDIRYLTPRVHLASGSLTRFKANHSDHIISYFKTITWEETNSGFRRLC